MLVIDRSTRYCLFSLRLAETSGQPAGDLLTETHEHHGFPYLHPGAAKHAGFLAEFFQSACSPVAAGAAGVLIVKVSRSGMSSMRAEVQGMMLAPATSTTIFPTAPARAKPV